MDLSRPDLVFALCWGATLLLSMSLPVGFSVEPDSRVVWLIATNIASFFVIYTAVRCLLPRHVRGPRVDTLQLGTWDEVVMRRFVRLLLAVWIALYLVTIFYSSGLPIVWAVTGAGKTYVDFGAPSLTGFLNMIRAFMVAASVMLYVQTKRPRYLLLPVLLLVSAVCEVSRGAILVLLAHAVGIALLLRTLSLRGLVRLGALTACFVLVFGLLGEFRGTGLQAEDLVGEQSWFLKLPVGVFFAFAYIVSPLNNLYYAADSIHPGVVPYYTLMTLVPTAIRASLFPDGEYPVDLYVQAFNATSFYSPLLADFGWLKAGLIVCGIQYVCSYVHVRAKQGSYFYTLVYPAIFMSVMLSPFYMYFLALVTVFYPVLAFAFLSYRRASLYTRGYRLRVSYLSARGMPSKPLPPTASSQ